ncbi:MAG: CHY zinc finger protein [Rhizomicrobium sp.]
MIRAVLGLDLDSQTRCAHWHSPLDVVAIKMKCCGEYYACRACHDALAGHVCVVWPEEEWEEKAVLCGVCRTELRIRDYLDSSDVCGACGAGFNPGCRLHRHLYFA